VHEKYRESRNNFPDKAVIKRFSQNIPENNRHRAAQSGTRRNCVQFARTAHRTVRRNESRDISLNQFKSPK